MPAGGRGRGRAAGLLIWALVLFGFRRAQADQAPNVILITIDTLRADHLGCYGDKSIQTPSIDRLARECVRFANAYTPVPITLPAHTALMTGEFPPANGVHDFTGNKLPSGTATIAKVLRDHGYTTAAFIGSAVLDSRFGLSEGFETYFDHFDFGNSEEVPLGAIERRGDRVVDEALKWLKLAPKRPFFLWVHLYDPHEPYDPPEPYASQYRARPYDGEIAFADAQVGRLITFLKQQGIFENAVLALASDHGESLGEHGEKTHGFFIYNSTLHVPLIIKRPGAAPRVVQDEVSLVDVMPTILEALEIPVPSSVQGRSLLGIVLGRTTSATAVSNIYAESYGPLLHFSWSPLQSLQWHGFKYIETTRPELYDIRADSHELHNLCRARPATAAEMKRRLHSLAQQATPEMSGSGAASSLRNDPALAATLRALGYVPVAAEVTGWTQSSLPDPKDRIQVYELICAAMSADQQGRYEHSLDELREAEKTEPDSLTLQYLLGRDYLRVGDFSRATRYFESVLTADPKYALAAYYLGLSRLQAGDLGSAEDAFNRTLQLDPTNHSAAFNLGVVYTRQHRADAAIQAFQHAIEILPGYAEAHEALGELDLYTGRPSDAVRELEQAVRIAPEMSKAHYHLGRAYAALGFTEKAQQEFDRAKKP